MSEFTWNVVSGATNIVLALAALYLAWRVAILKGDFRAARLRLVYSQFLEIRQGRNLEVVYALPEQRNAIFTCSLPIIIDNAGKRAVDDVDLEIAGPVIALPGVGKKWGTQVTTRGASFGKPKVETHRTDETMRWYYNLGTLKPVYPIGIACPFFVTSDSLEPIVTKLDFKDVRQVNVELSRSLWFRYDLIVRTKEDIPATASVTVTCMFAKTVNEIATVWIEKSARRAAALRRHPWKLSRWVALLRDESRMAVLVVPSLKKTAEVGDQVGFEEEISDSRYWILQVPRVWLISGIGRPLSRLRQIPPMRTPAT